jgi:hypothetical protein
MLHGQRVEPAEELAVAAQLEVELDPFDDRAEPFLLEPRTLRAKQTVRAQSPEGLSAPHTLGLLDPLASGI